MKKIFFILLIICILITSCGKNKPEISENSTTLIDDLGREVTVNNPKRVATLLGSFADMWQLAGGTVIASADDAWKDFNLDMSEDAINLGKNKTLSLESLYASDPDFVIASTNIKLDIEWMDTLEQSNIPVAYFDVSDFEDYLRVMKIFTDITGRNDLYVQNAVQVEEKVNKIIAASNERLKNTSAPTVLYLRTSASGIRVKTSEGTVLGEMLATLGCINIADSDKSLLENLSLERIMELDPDYIFMVQMGDDDEGANRNIQSTLYDNPAWSQLTAVKEGKVYILEKRLYNLKPNARWAEAYQKLEELLSND